MRIAIIGEKDAILGFKPLGIETHPVIDAKEAEERLRSLVQDRDYGTIYITESLSSQIKGLIIELGKLSNIVIIPARGEALGLARERLKKISEKALGTNILSSEE
ncbi:V-type ATP synthase subunit F [bacterium]|nr:V-type ATP synthase subunit F [bacterium]MBU4560983.1 V-type ATP synthase subunit F [bacterium]MCG2675591.1 V-type ATP synthase subunit F [bacterium]MCG2677801.1 V-type ATP synthase subunit F [bacterium]